MTVIDFNSARPQGSLSREISAEAIRDRLNADAEGFVRWLYSGRALISRGQARIGDVQGTPGASLHISLSGSDVGLWRDHATQEGGDLIKLYRACLGYSGQSDFAQSLKEIAHDFLGDPIEVERPAWRAPPSAILEERKAKLGVKPRADMLELGAPVANYKYFDTHGNVLAAVTRYEPDGTREGKTFRPWCFRTVEGVTRWAPGAPDLRPLYRLPQIVIATSVVLVEGEGKADALANVGIDATTAMQGARAPVDRTDWSPLAGKAVTIWPDNDEPGTAYAAAVAAKLTQLGCRVSVVPIPASAPPKWDAADCLSEGGDVAALIAAAVELTGAAIPQGMQFVTLGIMDLKTMSDPHWLVNGLIAEQSLGFIFGPPGCLKTFIALDLALSFASGQKQWWNRDIQRNGVVVYISSEGMADLKYRIMAWEKHRGIIADNAPFHWLYESVNFMKDSDVGKLLLTLQAVADKHGPLCAVFVDTVSRVLPGAEENLQKDMTLFVQACDAVRLKFNTTVIGLHHTNIKGTFRGSTVMPGAGDFVVEVRREPGAMSGSIFASKIKASEDGWEQFFKVEKIQLAGLVGPTSLVVDAADAKIKGEGSGWPSRDVCKEILAAIHEQWMAGKPWRFSQSSRNAVTNIMKRFNLKREIAADILATWTANGMIGEDDYNKREYGYRKYIDL